MPTCPAFKKNGNACGCEGRYFENHCGRHFNSKRISDPAYRARYEAVVAANDARNVERMQLLAQAEEQRAARRAAELEEIRRQLAQRRAERREKNQQLLDGAANANTYTILLYAQRLMKLWKDENIPGYDCVKAYVCLKYMSPRHDGFLNLMRATLKIYCLGNHPEHDTYAEVHTDEKQQTWAELTSALTPYGEFDYMTHITDMDKHFPEIQRRRAAEAEIAAAAAAAARHEQLLRDLNERPVVFRRDPEGSINLAAFAQDTQSVHRSSVQNATQKAVMVLISRQTIEGQDTLPEIVNAFNNIRIVRFNSEKSKQITITEITNDYFNTEAFSIMYGDVLDRVWAYIREHTERRELTIRLAQEVVEGLGQCSNGKMARLVNVLMGYDETIESPAPTRELFMARIAMVAKQAIDERENQARALFEEFAIPAEEHAVWLQPLLEA
jgi:hypothetical protein